MSIDTMLAIGIALATAVGMTVGPFIVEWYNFQRSKEEVKYTEDSQKIDRQHEFIIQYFEILNRYIELLESNEDYQKKESHLLQEKNAAYKVKIRILSLFHTQYHWRLEDLRGVCQLLVEKVTQNAKIEEALINCIELTQRLIENSFYEDDAFYDELRFLSNVTPLLLSDYLNARGVSEQTVDFVRHQSAVYQTLKERRNQFPDESIYDFSINADESVAEYFKRVFTYLLNHYENLGDVIKEEPGLVSFQSEVPWRNVVLLPIGSKKMLLNTNLPRVAAESFVASVLEEMKQEKEVSDESVSFTRS